MIKLDKTPPNKNVNYFAIVKIILINFFHNNRNIRWSIKYIKLFNKLSNIRNIDKILKIVLNNMVKNHIIIYDNDDNAWIKLYY